MSRLVFLNMNRSQQILQILELLSSSESSDEEEFISKVVCYGKVTQKMKIRNYVKDVVEKYSDDQFKEHFRITRATYKKLVRLFKRSRFFPKRRHGSKVHSAETHILSFLWIAGNKTVLRSVGDRFNISLSTLHVITRRVINFLLSIAPNIIRFPETEEEKNQVVTEFEQISGFPGVVGCVDGTYINIRTPANKLRSTYTNRHDMQSMTLQGICDSRRRFLDVFTGVPSKIQDARIFRLSFISSKVNSLGPQFHVLGDSAYPLSENLLTPYRDYGNLTPSQKTYNYKFSATRVRIENTFGMLKGRFRQLMKLEYHSVRKLASFIIACCVLHNACIDNGDLFQEEPCSEDIGQENYAPEVHGNREQGMIKRDNIAVLVSNRE